MDSLLRLLAAAASHGLLTGQIIFSAAFVGACELPNWLDGSQHHVLPLRHADGDQQQPAGPGAGAAGVVPMSRPIPAGDYVAHFDPVLDHHRTWLLAVLERLVDHEPASLVEGGPL